MATVQWQLTPCRENYWILRDTLPENNPICYVQKIDNVLFSHAGVLDYFAESVVPKAKYHDVEAVVAAINELGPNEMWNDASPIWLRPQHSNMRLYKPRKLLQVVGHTPMDMITKEGNLISCDVFSTYRDGKPIGTEEFHAAGYKNMGMQWRKIK